MDQTELPETAETANKRASNWEFTEARRANFEKMRSRRKANIEAARVAKSEAKVQNKLHKQELRAQARLIVEDLEQEAKLHCASSSSSEEDDEEEEEQEEEEVVEIPTPPKRRRRDPDTAEDFKTHTQDTIAVDMDMFAESVAQKIINIPGFVHVAPPRPQFDNNFLQPTRKQYQLNFI